VALVNFPVLVFVFSLLALWVAALIGARLRSRRRNLDPAEREDLGVILAASLTLLGLIIGFSFSMAVSRYDQRKNYEADEANTIGTEYARAGLLPADDASKVREMLKCYLDQRISFYAPPNRNQLVQINAQTAQLQTSLWAAIEAAAKAQPTPVVALAVSGMNDVLNSEAYTQAAWWNRIPTAAWCLMIAIGLGCNVLVGYNARRPIDQQPQEFLILPLIVSIAFFLIAEMDSPRGGVVQIHPQNLESLARSMHKP